MSYNYASQNTYNNYYPLNLAHVVLNYMSFLAEQVFARNMMTWQRMVSEHHISWYWYKYMRETWKNSGCKFFKVWQSRGSFFCEIQFKMFCLPLILNQLPTCRGMLMIPLSTRYILIIDQLTAVQFLGAWRQLMCWSLMVVTLHPRIKYWH